MKVTFGELSWPVRIGIILGWAVGILYALLFLMGMAVGAFSVIS